MRDHCIEIQARQGETSLNAADFNKKIHILLFECFAKDSLTIPTHFHGQLLQVVWEIFCSSRGIH